MALVLIGVTWRLWWGGSDFPAIPVGSWLSQVPWIADRICCCGLLLALAVVAVGTVRHSNWGWTLVLVSGGLLALLDQHRWQPWFYQLLLYAVIFRLGSPTHVARLLIWLTVSIYFYSALGKFDTEFLHTVGQQFWQGLTDLLGRSRPAGEPWAERSSVLIGLLPATELLLAAGLAWPATRRVAGVLTIAFHLGLMVLLGPLGLDHSAGVVFWNLQFAGQALCLFVLASWQQTANRPSTPPAITHSGWRNQLATAIVGMAIVLPLGERWGRWDHWASWALYAPHSSRTEVWIASTAVDRLPPSLQQVIAAEQAEQAARQRELAERGGQFAHGMDWFEPEQQTALWLRVPIERWSLAVTATPIYPQSRFQLGVARALARRIDSEFKIRVIVRGVAARWDGRRQTREFQGSSGLANAARQFWLGTTPRQHRWAINDFAAESFNAKP